MLKHFHFPSTNKYYHKNWASNIDHKKTEPIRVSDIDTMSTHTLRDFHHGWANLQMPCSLADEDSDLLTVPKFCLLTLRLGKMRYCSRFKWVKLTTQNQQKRNSLLHSFCHRLKTHLFRLHLHPKIKENVSISYLNLWWSLLYFLQLLGCIQMVECTYYKLLWTKASAK